MVEEWAQAKSEDVQHLLKPKDIYSHLENYIVGQNRCKRILSVAVHNHFKRIEANTNMDEVELQKSNVLLIGPTGSGKTLHIENVARHLKKKKISFVKLREPGGSKNSEKIRNLYLFLVTLSPAKQLW